tara:strand:- start:200 stop:433 length:234 start_codon:yes stop_codon:yes gene_type:complete
MIDKLFYMSGYGAYVWSSFIFTLFCFVGLYGIIKLQLLKEQKKFRLNYNSLSEEKVKIVLRKETYQEILINTSAPKV